MLTGRCLQLRSIAIASLRFRNPEAMSSLDHPRSTSSLAKPSEKRAHRQNTDTPEIALSKKLSYILRHGAEKEHVPIRSDGYVKVSDLVSAKRFGRITTHRI